MLRFLLQNRFKFQCKINAKSMLNLAPILAPFLDQNLSKSCKAGTLKIAISHETSLKKWPPRPPKQPPGKVFKKCMKIDAILSHLGVQKVNWKSMIFLIIFCWNFNISWDIPQKSPSPKFAWLLQFYFFFLQNWALAYTRARFWPPWVGQFLFWSSNLACPGGPPEPYCLPIVAFLPAWELNFSLIQRLC